jgi:minor histocompatibility antigen H13
MNSGQPALLFLVPGCCGAVGITAILKGEVKQVFDYEESKKETEDNKNKVQ